MSDRVPVAEHLFVDGPHGPRLLGSRCTQCATVVFPSQGSCPRCTSEEVAVTELATRGRLWTFTVQGFPPKAPPYLGAVEDFEPYGVGYVELPGQVKVEARLTEHDPARLAFGMEMELVLVPLATGEHGAEVVTFAFAPAERSGGT